MSRLRKGRSGAATIAFGAAVLVVVSSLLNHSLLRCVGRESPLHLGRQTPEGLKEVFATIWASELEELFNISSVGVLPPKPGAMFSLDDVLDDLKVRTPASDRPGRGVRGRGSLPLAAAHALGQQRQWGGLAARGCGSSCPSSRSERQPASSCPRS